MADERCTFRADVIVPNGRGLKRYEHVQCFDSDGHDDEHNFFVADTHCFGVTWERGRYVSRR